MEEEGNQRKEGKENFISLKIAIGTSPSLSSPHLTSPPPPHDWFPAWFFAISFPTPSPFLPLPLQSPSPIGSNKKLYDFEILSYWRCRSFHTIKCDFGSTWTLTTFIFVTMVTKITPSRCLSFSWTTNNKRFFFVLFLFILFYFSRKKYKNLPAEFQTFSLKCQINQKLFPAFHQKAHFFPLPTFYKLIVDLFYSL